MPKLPGDLLDVNDVVSLTVNIQDSNDVFIDPDSIPQISIVQPSGLLLFAPTSAGVQKNDIGKYEYDFTIPPNGPFGVYNYTWTCALNTFKQTLTKSFVVTGTNTPEVPALDGSVHIGDYYPSNYSQDEIQNLNFLLRMLKARLNNDGKSKITDPYGNVAYVTCSIFTVETLLTFLIMALSHFNQQPYFTNFTFGDTSFINQFGDVLANIAAMYAMSAKAIIEKGAEFTLTDNGIGFTPPGVSDMLKSQAGEILTAYNETVKNIKNSMRPDPIGLGSMTMTSGYNPAFRRLRLLRERQIV